MQKKHIVPSGDVKCGNTRESLIKFHSPTKFNIKHNCVI